MAVGWGTEVGIGVACGILSVSHPAGMKLPITHKPGNSNFNMFLVRDVAFLIRNFCLLTIFMITYACLGKEGRQM